MAAGGSGPAGTESPSGAPVAASIERSVSTTSGITLTTVDGPKKHVVKISFRLARRSRVVVTLRGPLPNCARVARFLIQGQRGPNTLRFNGRPHGRQLSNGSYLLGLRPARQAVTRWGALQIEANGVQALPRAAANSALAHCSSPAAAAAAAATGPFSIDLLVGIGTGEGNVLIAAERQTAKPESDTSATAAPVERPRRAGVLGGQIDDAADVIHPVFAIAILAVMIGSLLAIFVLVVSYLRGEGLGRPRY